MSLAEGMQFYYPSHTYPTIPYCAVFLSFRAPCFIWPFKWSTLFNASFGISGPEGKEKNILYVIDNR